MATILAAHYHENYAALKDEPVIREMASDLIRKPPPFEIEHNPESVLPSPTHELMGRANAHYRAMREAGKATVEPGSIGAVATAIIYGMREIKSVTQISINNVVIAETRRISI